MAKYRKKPVVIEAFKLGSDPIPDWFCEARTRNAVMIYNISPVNTNPFESNLSHATIEILEGIHKVDLGDFIIRGIKGELYICKPDIFEMTYEVCDDRTC